VFLQIRLLDGKSNCLHHFLLKYHNLLFVLVILEKIDWTSMLLFYPLAK